MNDTIELARRFNNYAIKHNSIIRARVQEDSRLPSFQLFYYVAEDSLVKKELYDEGCAVIYPSDEAKAVLMSFANELGYSGISYNNTGTIGWLEK